MSTTNSVRSVRFVRSGEATIQHVGNELGFGFCLIRVSEPGYYIELADCHVFVPESLLKAARQTWAAARKESTSCSKP